MTVGIALAILTLLDYGFAGFRDAAGRDGRIVKHQYYRAAACRGLVLAVPGLCLGGVMLALYLMVFPGSGASFRHAGQAASVVYAAYAIFVLMALIPYAVGGLELRTLTTVTVLGPCTSLRPLVILAGAIVAFWTVPGLPSFLGAVYALMLGFLAEPMLNKWRLTRPLP